jgi:hypothetical protein
MLVQKKPFHTTLPTGLPKTAANFIADHIFVMQQPYNFLPMHTSRYQLRWFVVITALLVFIPGSLRGDEQPLTEVDNHPSHALLPGENPNEVMLIDGIGYPIPPPWAGNTIETSDEVVSHLRKIPRQLTYNRTEIYLHAKALAPLKAMATAAAEEEIVLEVHSGYRSPGYQRTIIQQLMAGGRTFEDIIRYVAPPGYSEHMLGTVVDFYPSNWTFVDTEAYQWLRRHGAAYGFIETYHQNNRTGHPWEPWHWKYQPPPGPPILYSDAPIKTGRAEQKFSDSPSSTRSFTPE